MAIAWTFPLPLTWTTETPVMVKQWPLKRESLQQAHQLVQEQFAQGHLKLSTSPWNTPIFVIKKKSGKYRLLHDLRAVNDQMEPMGALQPGLPNPSMIPENWPILIIDLKDCFFTIALHPQDTKRFAFTLPAINRGEPDKRFEWTVLPQGMRNSPTICQLYVDAALQPLRREMPDTIIYHYMDDILLAQKDPFTDSQIEHIKAVLATSSLVIAPEKVQKSTPWKYLGWQITNKQVKPQKLTIATDISTLNDAQKLLGDLQWLKPIVGLPNVLLEKLLPLLKGTDPCTPVTLIPEQKEVLQKISDCITKGFVSRMDPTVPLTLTIWSSDMHLLGAVTQHKKKTGERVLEWISPPLQKRKTITTKIENLAAVVKKGRMRILEISGLEPQTVYLPMEKATLDWYLLNSPDLAEALLALGAKIETGPLVPRALQWIGEWSWIGVPLRRDKPISEAVTVYTDAGKKTRKAAIVWQKKGIWQQHTLEAVPEDSLQTLELLAVVWAVSNITEPLNVVSDSLYVVGVASRIEDAIVKEVQNKRLYELFLQLKRALRNRTEPYSIIHIRSHKLSTGLGEGNQRADRLVSVAVPMSQFTLAREAHATFHQNARGLQRQFQISQTDASAIVRSCPVCANHNNGMGLGIGVNPRGLSVNEIWQMDVTHEPSLGRLKYVHVTIDTYSNFIWATAQAGERGIHVTRHLTACFAVMGVCKQLKTDNGPAYIGQKVQRFLQQWGVKHITGIPHNPQGQAIVERANSTLKTYLKKFSEIQDMQERLAKALFVLNHLCIIGSSDCPAAEKHKLQSPESEKHLEEEMWVRYRCLKTGEWKGPARVLYLGRGYLCVSTPTGSEWIPARWTKPVRPSHPGEHGEPG